MAAGVALGLSGCGGSDSASEEQGPGTTAREPEGTGIPFGPNEVASALYGKPYSGTKIRLYPDRALAQLRELRTGGMHATIKLVGPQRYYQNADGSFSLEKWKAIVDRFRGIDFDPFIADRTIVAHQIVSEAKAPKQWGNTVITNVVLDEMARYSKSIWPGMATLVRTDPIELEEDGAGYRQADEGWKWQYLDAASARYLTRKDDLREFALAAQASADRQDLTLVVGLNVLAGGDGSSGIPSPTKNGSWAMSPAEIRRNATAMMLNTRACAVELWKYFPDDTYFSHPEIGAAMDDMTELAASRPAHSCAR